jgi:hypothetical protein
MAFGRVSTTTAMTSIASSFDKRSPLESPGLSPESPQLQQRDETAA